MFKFFKLLVVLGTFFASGVSWANESDCSSALLSLNAGNNGSGVLVWLKGSSLSDKALVMTSSTSFLYYSRSQWPEGNTFVLDSIDSSELNIRGCSGEGQVGVSRILLSTQHKNDVSLLELKETYLELEEKFGAKAAVVSLVEPNVGQKLEYRQWFPAGAPGSAEASVKRKIPFLKESTVLTQNVYAVSGEMNSVRSRSSVFGASLFDKDEKLVGITTTFAESKSSPCRQNSPCEKTQPNEKDSESKIDPTMTYFTPANRVIYCWNSVTKSIDLSLQECLIVPPKNLPQFSEENPSKASLVDQLSLEESAGYRMTVGRDGNEIVVGGFKDYLKPGGRIMVRSSLDGGKTWITSLDYGYPDSRFGVAFYNIHVMDTGHVIIPAIAETNIGGFDLRSLIFVRDPKSLKWNVVEPLKRDEYISFAIESATSAGDTIIAKGFRTDRKTLSRELIVYRSIDFGETWTLISSSPIAKGQFLQPHALVAHKDSAHISAGYLGFEAFGSKEKNKWLTQLSLDKGVTWKVDEEFLDGHLWSLERTSLNELYAGGIRFLKNGSHWELRKKSSYFSKWIESESLKLSPSIVSSRALSIFVSPEDEIYASGYIKFPSGKIREIVRSSKDRGRTWKTVARGLLLDDTDANYLGISVAKTKDSIFVSGQIDNKWYTNRYPISE